MAIRKGNNRLMSKVVSGSIPLSVMPAYAKELNNPAPPVPDDQAAIAYLKELIK